MQLSTDKKQEMLLQIVETWNLSESPEYRGFRCANCQKYKNEAWYHWLNFGNYKLPVHLCNDTCQSAFENGTIQFDQSKKQEIDRSTFGNTYKPKTITRFGEIVALWPDYKEPELKAFTCDECGKDLDIDSSDGQRKGYHVWWKMPNGKTLAELHFHKNCGHSLGIYTKEEMPVKN